MRLSVCLTSVLFHNMLCSNVYHFNLSEYDLQFVSHRISKQVTIPIRVQVKLRNHVHTHTSAYFKSGQLQTCFPSKSARLPTKCICNSSVSHAHRSWVTVLGFPSIIAVVHLSAPNANWRLLPITKMCTFHHLATRPVATSI